MFKPNPGKRKKSTKKDESYTSSNETWDKPATPVKTKKSTYMKGKVIDYDFIDSECFGEQRTFRVTGPIEEEGFSQCIRITEDRLNTIVNADIFMDSEIVDAGLSLIAKKLDDYSPFGLVRVLNITQVRQIASGQMETIEDGSFVTVFPRYFALEEETSRVRPLEDEEVNLDVNVLHYTLVSNLHCAPSEVNVYESLMKHRNPDEFLTEEQKTVLKLLTKTEVGLLKVNCVNVAPQLGNECGALSVGLAAKLCFPQRDNSTVYDAFVNVRRDLVVSLRRNELVEFESIRTNNNCDKMNNVFTVDI